MLKSPGLRELFGFRLFFGLGVVVVILGLVGLYLGLFQVGTEAVLPQTLVEVLEPMTVGASIVVGTANSTDLGCPSIFEEEYAEPASEKAWKQVQEAERAWKYTRVIGAELIHLFWELLEFLLRTGVGPSTFAVLPHVVLALRN